jgi:hypothetical protein
VSVIFVTMSISQRENHESNGNSGRATLTQLCMTNLVSVGKVY